MWGCSFIYRPPEEMRERKYKRSDLGFRRPSPLRVVASSLYRKVGSVCAKLIEMGRNFGQAMFTPLPERLRVARSEDLDQNEVDRLIRDPSALVRLELAWNGTVSDAVLVKLRHDRNYNVANVARRRLIERM